MPCPSTLSKLARQTPAERQALREQMGEPRIFRYQPDGSVREIEWDELS
ncbi:hypothetical protein ACQEVF_51425 [Nonomuraea polychroma]